MVNLLLIYSAVCAW